MHQYGASICPHYYVAVQHQCTNVVRYGAVQYGGVAGCCLNYAGASGGVAMWYQYNKKASKLSSNMTIQ